MLGASVDPNGTQFRVWAPAARSVDVVFADPRQASVRMKAGPDGYFERYVPGVAPGTTYWYRLDGDRLLPDPVSRFQPLGVHGPSEVVDLSSFAWSDADWRGAAKGELIIYELHVGTFSAAGTFDGVRERLPDLVDLGVSAIELMPIADFHGARNWGYDGVDLFAPARAYGRPADLQRLVDAAHGLGLAVILDVVYNHFGPEGAYVGAFAPQFFTERHHTPWGRAINLDGPGSREVRRFLIENARQWVGDYHVDGLRLDATHALIDDSPIHFLRELSTRLREMRPGVLLIAEDERRLPELIRPAGHAGWGLDACWSDDFHHHVRRRLAGDREGYYAPYTGRAEDIALTIDRGWWRRHSLEGGTLRAESAPASSDEAKTSFVFCLQNHDQVGNRAFGGRLHHQIEPEAFRAATALLLLGPETPLLFMGQEWAASTPFLYFTDFPEPLGHQVTIGRRAEFAAFTAFADPVLRARIPDPQAAATFEASKLRWDERSRPAHGGVLRLHRHLLRLRRTHPALEPGGDCRVRALDDDTIVLRREHRGASLAVVVRLQGAGRAVVPRDFAPAAGAGSSVLTTEDASFTDAPVPIDVAFTADVVHVTFQRPGAIVLA
jgi:maltooligosyltrehalose trehalohydrolase